MSNYKAYKQKALQNPEVKAEYDALQPEYDIIQAMIDARVQQHMTQKDLSAKTGITQADISRIENGTRNPSLSMVKKTRTRIRNATEAGIYPNIYTQITCKNDCSTRKKEPVIRLSTYICELLGYKKPSSSLFFEISTVTYAGDTSFTYATNPQCILSCVTPLIFSPFFSER